MHKFILRNRRTEKHIQHSTCKNSAQELSYQITRQLRRFHTASHHHSNRHGRIEMCTTDVTCKEYCQCHSNTPNQSNLENTVILSKENSYGHTTAAKQREDESPQNFSNKTSHIRSIFLFSVHYYVLNVAKIVIILISQSISFCQHEKQSYENEISPTLGFSNESLPFQLLCKYH